MDKARESGNVEEGDIIEVPLRVEEKKKVDFEDKLILAPLTTVGNLPFRRICKTFGADITVGEMAMCSNILQGQQSEWALFKRHPSEDVFGVQICGGHPDTVAKCCQVIEQQCNVDFVDINFGCPISVVCDRMMGSALLDKKRRLEAIVRSAAATLSIPLTIKLRTGRDEKKPMVHNLFPHFADWGVSAVTLHGRSRQQRYQRSSDWKYVLKCASLTTLPVIGNGDVYAWDDVILSAHHDRYPDLFSPEHEMSGKSLGGAGLGSVPLGVGHGRGKGVSSAMLARGALVKPWAFKELKEGKVWDISASERLDMLKEYVHCGLEHWGSDEKGVENTRRFLLEWLSFLHRYVPVGLLDAPQRLNQRPDSYFGRNDLETWMASPDVNDWVKLSELLLRPVPDNYVFIPKHKASSYVGTASSGNGREGGQRTPLVGDWE